MNYKELIARKVELLTKQIDELENSAKELTALGGSSADRALSLHKSVEKLDFARNILIEIDLTANREG